MHIVEKCILPLCRLEVCPGANALKASGQRIKVPQALGRRMTQMLEGAAQLCGQEERMQRMHPDSHKAGGLINCASPSAATAW